MSNSDSSSFKIETFSDRSFELGEGPHWNSVDQKLYFVDIGFQANNGLAASYSSDGKIFEVVHANDTKVPLSVVLPVDGHSDKFVISLQNGLYLKTKDQKDLKLLDELKDMDKNRFNDGKCDERGRIFIGTIETGANPLDSSIESNGLFVLNDKQKLIMKKDKVGLSNGICWSNDSKKMYYCDSSKRKIEVFDYDIETGNFTNEKILVNLNEDKQNYSSNEIPDGMTIDIKGNLWVAMFLGKRIVNIDGQTGKLIRSIEMPALLTTSCCFGGPNLQELYVTSANFVMEGIKQDPLAGYIFKITNSSDPDFRGFKPNYNAKLDL